jgi:curved DNA-binding protein CbpA
MNMLPERNAIENAIRLLFDFERRDFLHISGLAIDPEKLRKAFREKAKQLHPDRARALGADEKYLEAVFKNINNAYQLLIALVSDEELFGAFLKSYEPEPVLKVKKILQNEGQSPGAYHRSDDRYGNDNISAKDYHLLHQREFLLRRQNSGIEASARTVSVL